MLLEILNSNFSLMSIIDVYDSLIWTDRSREAGDFELSLPVDLYPFNLFQKDYYLSLSQSDHTMIIETTEIEDNSDSADMLTIKGHSLESLLNRRIIWGQKVLQGSLETAIHTLLNENVISPTNTDRQIPNFIFVASGDTFIESLTIDKQYFGDNLYDVIVSLCKEAKICFKVTLTNSNQFAFQLYRGTDRSYDQDYNPYVVFSSQYDNLLRYNYKESSEKYKNVALVGGEGQGSDRKLATVGSATGLSRREMFSEGGSISSKVGDRDIPLSEYIAQLEGKGKEDLAALENMIVMDGEIATDIIYTYLQDYFLGDKVQMSDDYGHALSVEIPEVIISSDEAGDLIYPSFKFDN